MGGQGAGFSMPGGRVLRSRQSAQDLLSGKAGNGWSRNASARWDRLVRSQQDTTLLLQGRKAGQVFREGHGGQAPEECEQQN